ncbi:MAG: SDR family oxidoreductase [Citrobacter freundii]|nr:SDR family oxidoreductase [Citrobacter freundii]
MSVLACWLWGLQPVIIAIQKRQPRVLPQKVQNEICSQIPLGRIGEPSEVASVIAFLASEQASYVSGSCVDVLGGYIA